MLPAVLAKVQGVVELLGAKDGDAHLIRHHPFHRHVLGPQPGKGLRVGQRRHELQPELPVLQRPPQGDAGLHLRPAVKPQVHHVLQFPRGDAPAMVLLHQSKGVVPRQAKEDDHHVAVLVVQGQLVVAPVLLGLFRRGHPGWPHDLVEALLLVLRRPGHDHAARGVGGDCIFGVVGEGGWVGEKGVGGRGRACLLPTKPMHPARYLPGVSRSLTLRSVPFSLASK